MWQVRYTWACVRPGFAHRLTSYQAIKVRAVPSIFYLVPGEGKAPGEPRRLGAHCCYPLEILHWLCRSW